MTKIAEQTMPSGFTFQQELLLMALKRQAEIKLFKLEQLDKAFRKAKENDYKRT